MYVPLVTVQYDIENHKTCSVDQLLTGFLICCLPETTREHRPVDLLETCLDAVLPICNGQGGMRRGRYNSGLRKNLEEYCAMNELETLTDRYAPFVLAFNSALEDLSELEDIPLRRKSDLNILFRRTDPSLVTATRSGIDLTRKPEITLASFVKRDDSSNEPENGVTWTDGLMNLEFNLLQQKRPISVPETFALKPVTQIEPQTFEYMRSELRRLRDMDSILEPQSSSEHPDFPANVLTSSKDSEGKPAAGERMLKNENTYVTTLKPLTSHRSACSLNNGTETGQKRGSPGDSSHQRDAKKLKTEDTSSRKLPAMLQSAIYASDRLSHAPWISSTINMVVTDEIAYVWYYDRESAIQSAGINFVEDLPHFLVLLLALQRFSLDDWGVHTALQDAAVGNKPFHFPEMDVDVTLNLNNCLRDHSGLFGRASRVFGATSDSVDPLHPMERLSGKDLVAKIYYPETNRLNEAHIVEMALQRGKDDPEIEGHIPDVVASADFPQTDTANIRKALGIYQPGLSKHGRVLRIIIVRRYRPITDLVGETFWLAFWQCFRCHYRLWLRGIQHGDISPANLMYEKRVDGTIVGKLNDFDLAHVDGHPRPADWGRTGTMPFMALDLLTKKAWEGKVARLYRHDCETFGWVLLWICARYQNGKEIPDPPFEKWRTDTYEQCHLVKYAEKLVRVRGTSSYEPFWPCAVALLAIHRDRFYFARKAAETIMYRPTTHIPEEPTTLQVIQEWSDVFDKPVFHAIDNPLKGLKLEL